MKKVLSIALLALPTMLLAQNVEPAQQSKIDSLRAVAAAKAKAAEEAARAAQEAARAALEAAEALKTEQNTAEGETTSPKAEQNSIGSEPESKLTTTAADNSQAMKESTKSPVVLHKPKTKEATKAVDKSMYL